MLLLALILVPVVAALPAYFLGPRPAKLGVLLAVAVAHTAATAALWVIPRPSLGNILDLDSLGLIFLTIVSALFLLGAISSVGYLIEESEHAPPASIYCACMLLFLAAMTLSTTTLHLGLFWVAVEATTLASAPLIYARGSVRSLEATWKYLVLCSVGIALALLGTFFLAIASAGFGHTHEWDVLYVPAMLDTIPQGSFDAIWLKAAFVLLLVGYGTKMGLAPMHSWLPDAHSEAPSPVSALLSGALLNCAFLGILRGYQICLAAGERAFADESLMALGLFSLAISALFIYAQTDYKRMLAYSSIENMGILAVGLALGGPAVYGSLLHAVNHSVAKALLFLTSGNLLLLYGSKRVEDVRGALRLVPITGALWIAGFLAISGTPPFGPFASKFTILATAAQQGRYLVLIGLLLPVAVIFLSMSRIVIGMTTGPRPAHMPGLGKVKRNTWLLISPLCLAAMSLGLGLTIPGVLNRNLQQAATSVLGDDHEAETVGLTGDHPP
ncbi:MAG: hydrogenase-4 component, partial [Trebonia sp.]|nr:hydrogenase-4 component [Trebonia sp.]